MTLLYQTRVVLVKQPEVISLHVFSMKMTNQLQMLKMCVFHVLAAPTMCSFRTKSLSLLNLKD